MTTTCWPWGSGCAWGQARRQDARIHAPRARQESLLFRNPGGLAGFAARPALRGRRAGLLEEGGNTVLDGFLCQGRVDPKILEISRQKGRHPMTPERRARLEEAARHPDTADLAEAGRRWQLCLAD